MAKGPDERLTTIGWLKHLKDPGFGYFEWQFRKQIHSFLTEKWYLLHSGRSQDALDLWLRAMKVMELDCKSMRDLFLLLQTGLVGRAHANRILWKILSGPAIDGQYRDLNNKVTHEIYNARRLFDRPPREHADLRTWTWDSYQDLPLRYEKWAPNRVPRGVWTLTMGPGGMPLEPPDCWGPILLPAADATQHQ